MLIDLLFGCATAFGDSGDGGIDLEKIYLTPELSLKNQAAWMSLLRLLQ
jgi:hypothetical protein